MARAWPQLLLSGLVAGLLIVGLLTTGGPAKARLERRDDQRLSELQALVRQARCLADAADAVPEDLQPTAACPWPLPVDAILTEGTYHYAREGETGFRICTRFEDPDRLKTRNRLLLLVEIDGASCLTGARN